MPDIDITDSLSVSADLDIADDSVLSEVGLTRIISHTASFVGNFDKPVDQSCFTSANFGADFAAPSVLIGQAATLAVSATASGAFALYGPDQKTLFDDDGFAPRIEIAPDEYWISFEVDASLDGKLSASADGFGICVEGSTSTSFATYSLLKPAAGKLPTLQQAMATALQNYSVNHSAAGIRRQPAGTVNVSDLSGSLKFKASYSLPINCSALASVDLPFNYSIAVTPSATLKVAGQITLIGEFVVRAYKVSDTQLQFGVYKKKGRAFSVSLEASAGLQATMGDTDMISSLFGAVFQQPDLSKLGITGEDADTLDDAMKDCVDSSLAISLNASCSASRTDEAAVVYAIDLAGGDQQQTDAALSSALAGDWTQLSALPNATQIRNIFKDTDKSQHKIIINLLGIYNAETVDDFIKTCTILHDQNGQVLITDKASASHVAVASAPFLADADKLRSALAESFLATVTYAAGSSASTAGAKIQTFSVSQRYFVFQNKMSRHDMRQQVMLGKTLKLISGNAWDNILATHVDFGHARIDAAATYDFAAAMKLFFADPTKRTPHLLADLTTIGRQILASLIDPSDPTGQARIAVLRSNTIWAALDTTGNVGAFGTLPELKGLSTNALADVGVDWTDVTWWAGAMAMVAPKLSDMLAALEQSTAKDPTTDANFMKKRDALAGVLGQVARNSRAAFAGGWGLAVMETVSGFAAPGSMDINADGLPTQHYESANP